jgi:predicted HTH domain antitoxin
MAHWVMDYETLSDCFLGVFEHYKTDERRIFVMGKLRNDFPDFITFLYQNKNQEEWHISFNGLGFDSQITQYCLENAIELASKTGEQIAQTIYGFAQSVIDRSSVNAPSHYMPWKLSIKQLDVFKLNHWDNPAKSSSLKWIQYSMDWQNVMEMPIHHTETIDTEEKLDIVISYCINDVISTKRIMELSKSQVNLRAELTKEYNIDLYNASEPRISKELFAQFLSKELNKPVKEIKEGRTRREVIRVQDIILPYIKFNTPVFQELLEKFKTVKINPENTKGSFKYSVTFKDVKTDFGLGGVHGANKSGIYQKQDGLVIMSSDVTSFYPNLAIRNKWSPGHIDKDKFCNLYEWFFDERKKIPKSNPLNYVYKIILNSTYGLSNDANSFLYDPEFTMRITINGQLSLMMLYEMICEAIPTAIPIMQNTDGLETMIPKESIPTYMEVCTKWEELTQLQLEHEQYQKIVFADVNNYIAVFDFKETEYENWKALREKAPDYLYKILNGKFLYAPTKCKGRFEYQDLALHKNKSKLVIPKALYQYFVHDKLPEKYLEENKNILDYCAGVKIKGTWKFIQRGIINGEMSEIELQQIVRYYISKTGVKLVKRNTQDGREIQAESGSTLITIFNVIENKPWDQYNVDKSYYLRQIEKEIANISKSQTQLKLF